MYHMLPYVVPKNLHCDYKETLLELIQNQPIVGTSLID